MVDIMTSLGVCTMLKPDNMIRLNFQANACDWIILTLLKPISGADNSNNSSNPDTSMKFGKKHPYVLLFQNQS